MTKITSSIGCSYRIEQVISEAKEYIVIVTPYLKIPAPLLSRLLQADKRAVKILLLYGKNELAKEQKEQLESFQNLNIYFLKNLHAKCFLNESTGLLSSMNLYEYSQVNNWELGVLFDEDDVILKDKLLEEIELMFSSAEAEVEKFQRFNLVKKRYSERLSDFLNNHFKTQKFQYCKEESEIFHDYWESIIAKEYPNKNMDIQINPENSRIDFVLNYQKAKLTKLKSSFNFNIFKDEFRVYNNNSDRISMYNSIFHRDKWETYSDKYKFEHIAKGIVRMKSYLEKKII